MGILHGRAGRLTAKNGGFRPGQLLLMTALCFPPLLLDRPRAAAAVALAVALATAAGLEGWIEVGFGRIVALQY
jgi:hypothetical protein